MSTKPIRPNKEELALASYLQSLFPFPTIINFYIYNFGIRRCTIIIEADNEEPPMTHSSTDDYGRGPNSTIVAKFARENFGKKYTWYSSSRGFMVPAAELIKYKASV